MNYDKMAIITYPYYDKKLRDFVFDKNFDLKDVEEFEDLAEDIYRRELLDVFQINAIEELNTDQVFETFPQLLEIIPDNPTILFSFHFFFFTHKCIAEDFNESIVSKLKDYIKNI